MNLNLQELQELEMAISHIVGYTTDNSCSDSDCCGGPYYTKDDYDDGIATLTKYGLTFDNSMLDI